MSRLLMYGIKQQRRKVVGTGFKTEWTVSGDATARTITLPLYNSGTFNCTVKWGDGTADSTVTAYNDADRIHTYASNGTYTVEIIGECPAWSFNNEGDKLKLTDIVNWGDSTNFGGFQYLTGGFFGCSNLKVIDAGILNTTNLTSLYNTFRSTGLESINVTGWDTSHITTMNALFHNNSSLTTITGISSWDVSSCTDLSEMFSKDTSLVSLDLSGWVMNSTATSISFAYLFDGDTALTSVNLSNWDLRGLTTLPDNTMFRDCTDLDTIDATNWNLSSITSFGTKMSTKSWWYNNKILKTFIMTGWVFNTSANVSFSSVFWGCTNLISIGDASGWNTSKFITIDNAFRSTGLTSIDVTGWDVSHVTTMYALFYSCPSLTTITGISSWNISSCANVCDMFGLDASLISLDTSNWDTSSITDCSYMCEGCTALTTAMPAAKWWNRSPGIGAYAKCFYNATQISNYALIPAAWK